jgi:hypothetical protein
LNSKSGRKDIANGKTWVDKIAAIGARIGPQQKTSINYAEVIIQKNAGIPYEKKVLKKVTNARAQAVAAGNDVAKRFHPA